VVNPAATAAAVLHSHGEHASAGALSTIINKDGAAFFTVLVNFC
jgi:hypothetical protein